MKTFPKSRAHRGFALIVVLMLMVLLSILVVGLLSLSSVELRRTSQDSAMREAQANAHVGLALAVGELQRYLGPDQRISARAETLVKDTRIGSTLAVNTPKSWWIGVSHSDGATALDANGRQVAWLISGLKESQPPKAQIDSSFEEPVSLIGAGSLDLSKTGGQDIQAGKVPIRNGLVSGAAITGAYAYYIDDNGMKAQLAPSNPEVRNDRAGEPLGGGVLPGAYPLNILKGMDALKEGNSTDHLKLISLNNIPLMGLDQTVAREKYFSYTTLSQGVLSDVREGGLKKDLTIAFENDAVFDKVFPSSDPDKYQLVDPEKRTTEMTSNGYIHWNIFKDYYNLKDQIKVISGRPTLELTLFDKTDMTSDSTSVGKGALGPHQISSSASPKANPYGDFVMRGDQEHYKHNPITSILAHFQQDAWLELKSAGQVRTHAQIWTSHYNPYNITIRAFGDQSNTGPRLMYYPQVRMKVGSSGAWLMGYNTAKQEIHVPHEVMLEPGRGHVFGVEDDIATDLAMDKTGYSSAVHQIVNQSIYSDVPVNVGPNTKTQLNIEFFMNKASFAHGVDHALGSSTSGDFEVAQVFYAPFSWNLINVNGGRPGASRLINNLTGSQLNMNTRFSHAMLLRTTREPGSAIRPLIDANIRAVWNNPKWDSPLGLSILASYSPLDPTTIQPVRPPQMSTTKAPEGHAFWGGGHDASEGVDRVILFDVPREDLVSLGQLQHASAGRFSYEPTYLVGNSYANSRIPLGAWQASISDTYSSFSRGTNQWKIPGNFNLYDGSYLVNEVLWDSYVFTTLPQTRFSQSYGVPEPNWDYVSLLERKTFLLNPRFIPYEPEGSTFTAAVLKDTGTATTGSFFHNAGHLLIDGAFNVNSTSVDAWEAFLSGTHKLPVQKVDDSGKLTSFSLNGIEGVRFPRVKNVFGDAMKTDSIDENYWTGFRDLKSSEVRALADEIVKEIKARGPFLTLGQFVNRKLENSEAGKSGVLQAALDATVNHGLAGDFESSADSGHYSQIAANSTQGAGFPGQLLQGDVLQALSPYMQVRSDTFTIRSYGESRNAAGAIVARAWCEAVVQRHPDPVQNPLGSSAAMTELVKPSSAFGRRFHIVSFRWLHPSEV